MDTAQAGERWFPVGVLATALYVFPFFVNFTMLAAVAVKRIRKIDNFEQLREVDLIILNICLSDGLTSLFYLIGYIWTGANFYNSEAACSFMGFVIPATTGPSLMFLFVLAYSRYLIIKKPTGFTWSIACKMVVVVWVAGISYGIFVTAAGIVDLPPSGVYCIGGYSYRSALRALNGIVGILVIFGPSVGIIWFYSAILKAVVTNAKDFEFVKKVAKMCAVLSSLYIVTTTPYGASIIYSLATGDFLPRAWDGFTSIFVILNFWANPIAYCVYQKRYRKALFDFLRISQLLTYLGYEEMESSSEKLSSITLDTTKASQKSGGGAPQEVPQNDGELVVSKQEETKV